MDIITFIETHLGFFLLVFARISAIFSSAPFFGSRNVPVYVKAAFSLLLTYITVPIIPNPAAVPDAFLPYLVLLVSELLVGLIIGFAASLVFYGVQMAGQLLDMQIGFGIVNIFDPLSGQQMPLIGNFKYILALIVFLTTNSHHLFITALVSSFKLIPPAGIVFSNSVTGIIVDMVSGLFVVAIKICLPVLIAIILTDIALGILARTMPQMNIFIVGIPGKIMVGMFVLTLALPFYILFLEVAFNAMYADIYHLLAVFSGT